MQLRLASTCRNTEHRTDLLVREPFHIVQHEHLSCASRQPCNRALEVHLFRVHRLRRRARGCCAFVIVIGRHRATAFASIHPSLVEHDVHREPVQPGRERTFAPEGRQLLPRSHEDVLGQLLGARPVTRHSHTEREDVLQVRAVDMLECMPVSARRAGDRGAAVIGGLSRGLNWNHLGRRRRHPNRPSGLVGRSNDANGERV